MFKNYGEYPIAEILTPLSKKQFSAFETSAK
jgi:hypothetical protein